MSVVFEKGVQPKNIHPDSQMSGQTVVSGERTCIGAGAIINNSYIHNVVIEEGAHIVDSIIIDDEAYWRESPRSDFEARWAIGLGNASFIGKNARVFHSHLTNFSVGERTEIFGSSGSNSTVSHDCIIRDSQCDASNILAFVTILGPTEIGGAYVGHHATFDAMGCNGALFTNDFLVVEFDDATGKLVVREVLDIPHVSRYGMNVINSLHSGELAPLPQNVFKSFGKGDSNRWNDCLWHMGKNRFDPCCVVGGWTKVVGRYSQTVFRNYEDLLMCNNSTHALPFSVSGNEASLLSGQVMPGERYCGELYKSRNPAWVFSHAPAVILEMVAKVAQEGDPAVADKLPILALSNAIAFTKYLARSKKVIPDATVDMSKNWAGFYGNALALLTAHKESGLWEFKNGEALAWQKQSGEITPRNIAGLSTSLFDPSAKPTTISDLLACDQPDLKRTFGVSLEEIALTNQETYIDPQALISPHATIGPGVHIFGKSVICEGAILYRSVIKNSTVEKNVSVKRSYLEKSIVENTPDVSCASLINSQFTGNMFCKGSRLLDSFVGPRGRTDPFSSLTNTVLKKGAMIGGIAKNLKAESNFFLIHPQGYGEFINGCETVIHVDGKLVAFSGVPMIGGGGRAFGTLEKPINLECCFIGSNSILNAGTYISFGCFVLEGTHEDEGLLPFTLKKGPGAANDQPAAVLFQQAHVVISSIINPSFHGSDASARVYAPLLVVAKIQEAIDALAWVTQLRCAGLPWQTDSPFSKYRNLKLYSDAQIKGALTGYKKALIEGSWEMEICNEELRFCGKGDWKIVDGAARWARL